MREQVQCPSLGGRLQEVTEALTAARTPHDVFEIVLSSALEALGTPAGTVLLVQEDELRFTARLGPDETGTSVWQNGHLKANTPATAVLATREPLFFEVRGELTAAWPDLEAQTGGTATVASAVLPMFLDGHPLGTIALDFQESHSFPPEERRFLRTLAALCAVALGRVRLTADLQAQLQDRTRLERDTRAHEAFVAFTEAVGTQTDVLALASEALKVLRTYFPDASVGYYDRDGDKWKARLFSDDLQEEVTVLIQGGLPAETPMFRQVLEAGQATFTNDWNMVREEIAHTEHYGAVANVPLLLTGQVHAVLSIGRTNTRQWSERDQLIVRAVGRGLTLALERTRRLRQLQVVLSEQAQRTAELNAVIESMPDAVYIGNAQGIQQVNRRGLEMLGFSSNEELHQHIPVLSELLQNRNPDTLERLKPEEEAFAIALGGRRHEYDVLARHLKTGEDRLIRTAAAPILVNDQVVGAVAVNADITNSRLMHELQALNETLEAQVEERTALVANLNAELRVYTASISRDLEEPARRLNSFMGLIERRLDAVLDDKARYYLHLVKDEASRLHSVVRELRELSLLERREFKLESVSLTQLVVQVRSDLQPTGHHTKAEWIVGDLPRVWGDRMMLRQVFSEVFMHALVATRNEEVPIIHVGYEDQGEEVMVWVRDNGITVTGRDMSTLFEVSGRDVDPPLIGQIGLPNVRRIVTRHGGRMWAEVVLDGTARVCFTLPKPR
ncbi:GAF domain-containing protein [Deinococcus navajonensis]|uniref:histidine kinase n=1 Tax=Deinococcus navajonensis TaxID=309884 RepID=A0ABV8XJA3_9DEIO